jgi:hypothetical protein
MKNFAISPYLKNCTKAENFVFMRHNVLFYAWK